MENKIKKNGWTVLFAVGMILLVMFLTKAQNSRSWQWDSEDLVMARIYQMQEGQPNPGGWMGHYDQEAEKLLLGEVTTEQTEMTTYRSGTGFQGTVFA